MTKSAHEKNGEKPTTSPLASQFTGCRIVLFWMSWAFGEDSHQL